MDFFKKLTNFFTGLTAERPEPEKQVPSAEPVFEFTKPLPEPGFARTTPATWEDKKVEDKKVSVAVPKDPYSVTPWQIAKKTVTGMPGVVKEMFGLSGPTFKQITEKDVAWHSLSYGERVKAFGGAFGENLKKLATSYPKAAIQFLATPAIGAVEEITDTTLGGITLPTKLGEWIGPLTGTRTQQELFTNQGYSSAEAKMLVVAQQMSRALPFVTFFGAPAYIEALIRRPTIEKIYEVKIPKMESHNTAVKISEAAKLPKPTAETTIRGGMGQFGQVVKIKGQPNQYVIINTNPITGAKSTFSFNISDPVLQLQASAFSKTFKVPEITAPAGVKFPTYNPALPGMVNWIKTTPTSAHIAILDESLLRILPTITKRVPAPLPVTAPPIPAITVPTGKEIKTEVPTPKVPEAPLAPPPLPPTTISGSEGGFVKVPNTEPFINSLVKIIGKLDIETPFKHIGAPKTGKAVKVFFSRYGAETEKGKDIVLQLSEQRVPDSKQSFTQDDYINATYLAAQEDVVLPGVDKTKLDGIVKITRDYLDGQSARLQEYEILADPWPAGFIKRTKENLRHLQAQLKAGADPERLAKINEEIGASKNAIKFLEDHNIKYVPIPLRVWFEDIFNSKPDSAIVLNRFFKERETLDIKALAEKLIDNGIIQPQDVDIRNILAVYSRKLGWSYAWSDIIRDAREEGLIKMELDKDEQGVWKQLPSWAAPELKGHFIHPSLSGIFERTFNKNIQGAYNLSRPLAYAKMMAFDNPLFLGMYNLYEGSWLAVGETIRSVIQDKSLKAFPNEIKAWGDAIKMMIKKDDLYWSLMENGLQSKPYIPPFEDFAKDLERLKETSFTKRTIKYIKQNVSGPLALDSVYRPLWDIAWNICDRFPRLISANFLMRQGYTPTDAAQLAALHHGDYAMMSPELRKQVNKVFFTPVFPVTMAKLHTSQMKALADTLEGAAKAKAPDKRASLLIGSAIATLGMIWGRKKLMERWGFEEKDFGYRYVKDVEDPETGQIKQLTVTIPSPDNVWLRKWHRWKTFPEDLNKLDGLMNRAKWELHPLWRMTLMNLQNRKVNGDPIYNVFDEPEKIAVDTMKFSFNEIVRVVGRFDDYNDEQKKNAQRAFRQDVGPMWYYVLKPTMNHYLNYTKEESTVYKIRALEEEFGKMMGKEEQIRDREKLAPVSEKELDIWIENLLKKVDDLLMDLPEFQEEKITPTPVDRTLEMEEKTEMINQFTKDFNLPTEKEETLPKDLQFPEEKENNKMNEFLDFDIRDIVK